MKVILLMLTCALCGSTNSSLIEASRLTKTENSMPSANPKVSITFTGTVKSIELLGEQERELKVIPVGFDSRFAVTVHIMSVASGQRLLKEGTEVIFAIHSPALLFRAEEDVVGKKYRFKLTGEEVSNGSRFSRLTASSIKDEGSVVELSHRSATQH